MSGRASGGGTAVQLPFDLPHRPALERADFWVTASNRQAVEIIDKWPDWASNAAIIVGPRGSGKTHLAEVWRKVSSARKMSISDLSPESVPGALDEGALVLEDAPGKNLDETALFHLLNLSREQGATVLVTSRQRPDAWPVALADLISRLKALVVAELHAPDDVLLKAVLAKLFSDRQIKVEAAVLDYMVVRMERELSAAYDLVAELDALALAEQSAITKQFVSRVLNRQGGLL